MRSENDGAAEFRSECLRWQKLMGLTDWFLTFHTETAPQGHCDEAVTDLDCDTRHASITYYIGVQDAMHPRDVAYHEMLHLLMADLVVAAINARNEDDPILGREEHRVIYKLHAIRGVK